MRPMGGVPVFSLCEDLSSVRYKHFLHDHFLHYLVLHRAGQQSVFLRVKCVILLFIIRIALPGCSLKTDYESLIGNRTYEYTFESRLKKPLSLREKENIKRQVYYYLNNNYLFD